MKIISPDLPKALRVGAALLACCLPTSGQVAIDGTYWRYNGERVLLVGGWNHEHNPFIDHDTDNDRDNQGVSTPEEIAAALDELAAAGGNCLRCVLDPAMAAAVQNMSFCAKQGGKYDLNRMEGPFWTRLDDFLRGAGERDIIVQIEVWDRFDLIDGSWGAWPGSPWNPRNNVNYTSAQSELAASYNSYQQHPFLQGVPGHPVYENAPAARRQKYDAVRRFQEKFMDKFLDLTLPYDNVLYCMNNETHEDPAWGAYWIKYIRRAAAEKGRKVLTTDMFDDVFTPQESKGLAHQFSHRDTYDYVDISQANSRHRDQAHWDTVHWIVQAAAKTEPPCLLYMTKVYGNDLALGGKPWSGFRPGDTDNGIEEFWRSLIAGVAGAKFHRPTSGIGLYPEARASIRAVRKVESKVKFWDVNARMDLLADRESDEAYLAANPGKAYILYFTKNGGGSVGLKLDDHASTTFQVTWVNIGTGEFGPSQSIRGGRTVTIARPDATTHWVAAIVRKGVGS